MRHLETPDLAEVRFGFFGEFGYGLTCWHPYLNFLKSKGLGPICTIGPLGSAPFYPFSDNHIEIDSPFLDSWGGLEDVWRIGKNIRERLIAPVNELPRKLSVAGFLWCNPNLHVNLSSQNYQTLNLKGDKVLQLPARYCVINVKNYTNWGLDGIQNYYTEEDLEVIGKWAARSGIAVVLNRFPSPMEATSSYFESDPRSMLSACGVDLIDMAPIYAAHDSLGKRNEIQIATIRNAYHIFATQGGNAPLSIILNRNVSIIMRGGFDYPDFIFLAKMYGTNLDIAYHAVKFDVVNSQVEL